MSTCQKDHFALTLVEERLYEALSSGEDIGIDSLLALTGSSIRLADGRKAQMALGPYISRLNRKLYHHWPSQVIKPGEARLSYRLYTRDF